MSFYYYILLWIFWHYDQLIILNQLSTFASSQLQCQLRSRSVCNSETAAHLYNSINLVGSRGDWSFILQWSWNY